MATVLMLMHVQRGLRGSCMLPVVAFNSPPCLGEVPNHSQWGCTEEGACNMQVCARIAVSPQYMGWGVSETAELRWLAHSTNCAGGQHGIMREYRVLLMCSLAYQRCTTLHTFS